MTRYELMEFIRTAQAQFDARDVATALHRVDACSIGRMLSGLAHEGLLTADRNGERVALGAPRRCLRCGGAPEDHHGLLWRLVARLVRRWRRR